MRRQLREGLAEVEIVAEFGTRFALAIADPRGEAATRPHQLTQRTNEIRILGEPLDQDGARAVERGGRVRHLLFGVDESGSRSFRLLLWVHQQQIREWFEAGL